MTTATLALGTCTTLAPFACADDGLDPQTATGLLRWFVDSKHVAVRSMVEDYSVPLHGDVGLTLHWNNERVTVPAIQAPPGTQAAVDAITTASRPISGNAYSDYIKVRNELEGEVTKGNAAVQFYHSSEPDYLAQQLGATYNRDFKDRQLNLAVGSSYGWDDIEPLPDDNARVAADHKNTLHWNAVATEILSPATLMRLGVEYNHVEGLQHNPYRRVYAGGTSVPERHPETRERRDVFIKLNHYLENRSSLKVDYRFYDDDWGIVSHEASGKLSQYVTHGVFARYEYRYYTQTAARFYRPEYATTSGIDGFLTGDYRMGPLSSHLFGLTLNFDLGALAAGTPVVRHLDVSLDYERYFNNNNYSADILETEIEFRF
jgi:hypothetical protein